jgi:hypothetical protein
MPAVKKHFNSEAKRAAIKLLRAKVSQGNHEIAGRVKGHPGEILTFAKANSSHSNLSLCQKLGDM